MVETVIQRTKLLLKEKGLKQKYLFEQIGKSPVLFNDWKNGKSKPTDEVLKNIADVLDTTPEYLLGKTEQKEKPAEDGGLGENIVRFLGRDGKVLEKKLTPELLAYLESIPDSDDKL